MLRLRMCQSTFANMKLNMSVFKNRTRITSVNQSGISKNSANIPSGFSGFLHLRIKTKEPYGVAFMDRETLESPWWLLPTFNYCLGHSKLDAFNPPVLGNDVNWHQMSLAGIMETVSHLCGWNTRFWIPPCYKTRLDAKHAH